MPNTTEDTKTGVLCSYIYIPLPLALSASEWSWTSWTRSCSVSTLEAKHMGLLHKVLRGTAMAVPPPIFNNIISLSLSLWEELEVRMKGGPPMVRPITYGLEGWSPFLDEIICFEMVVVCEGPYFFWNGLQIVFACVQCFARVIIFFFFCSSLARVQHCLSVIKGL